MALRCAPPEVEAGTQFRRVNGHLYLRALRTALQRQVAADNAAASEHNRHQQRRLMVTGLPSKIYEIREYAQRPKGVTPMVT
jgi:hypothetical protein